MEQSDTGVNIDKASPTALSDEPLPVVSTHEVSFVSKHYDGESVVLPSEAISAAASGHLNVSSSLKMPVQSGLVILDKAGVSSVSKTISDQSSLSASEDNLPAVRNSHPSPLESEAPLVVARSPVADSSLQSTNTALPGRESCCSPMRSDCAIPVDERGQTFRNNPSGNLGLSNREQDVASGYKVDVEPSLIVTNKSPSDDKTSEMDVEMVRPTSNGQISSQVEKPSEKSAESPVNVTQSTLNLDVTGKGNLKEKAAKRGTEVEYLPEKPAKRKRRSDIMFSVSDTVEAVLGNTAEIVIVLAGMAQMRAGRPFTGLEKDLAAVACQNIASLVSKVAPNALVSKEALNAMIRELDLKRTAQTRKEDHARAKALAEAEASARAKAAKADTIAKLKAEELAKQKADGEAEERKQAALKVAAAVAKSPIKDSSGVEPLAPSSTPPGQPAQALSPPVELKISSPTPVTPPSFQTQVAAQACDVSQSEAIPEKSVRENSPSQQLSKTSLGKPPKVRNRIKKDLALPTLLSPDYLEYIQSQVPETQKAHVTHKQLCLAVQQFIQEQMPHPSQSPQAIPPSYMNTPAPCQLCKLVAKDAGTVMVCDSCDELFHVKCLQPNNHAKGVPKGDWNCPQCLSGGRSYRKKYGPYLRGSINGVKLWAPHDTFEDNDALINGSGTESSGRQSGLNSNLKMQAKLTVDVETGSHTIKDDRSVGNYGGSPHLIVHLVNEPSPRTIELVQNSSLSHVGGYSMGGSVAGGSQLKLTSRPGSGDSRAVSEEAGNGRPRSRENEGDFSGSVLQTSGSQVELTERSDEAGTADIPISLPGKHVEVPLIMEWVGESTRTGEGKTYYRSCRVGGQTYHLSDCALFRPETPDVPPYIARLQVLWEDLSTNHKWVRVSWCYYPSDIPLTMGRPGRAEPEEVYESNHCDNNLVGSIQGPCLVLPPKKYYMELERRKELQKHVVVRETFPPVFLSRWLYDAPKGIFKPVTE